VVWLAINRRDARWIIIFIRAGGYFPLQKHLYVRMENGKVQDSEFEDGQIEFPTRGPVFGLLNRVIQQQHKHLKASFISGQASRDSSTADSTLLQRYSFKISGYRLKESVEYQIVLVEKKLIRGKVCSAEYLFSTRYSKLLKLHEQLNSEVEFPPKKFFNAKKPEFLELRKQQLE
jgi:hypothetical protein